MPTSRLAQAEAHLAAADPVMAGLVARHGPCVLSRPSARRGSRAGATRFGALVESVLYQQLAGSAAAAIHARFVTALGGDVTPETVLGAGEAVLRGAGLSGSKALTILGLAEAVADGSLGLDRIGRRSDQEIVAELVRLRGIGPWTAQMFCIFTLGRLDVWPASDYGVRKGYAVAYGLDDLPAARWLEQAGQHLSPYRSVAAWYLWRAAEAG
ncbi:MAG: DNA-3-methyladenine glycosylase family protein [Acidimicrobiales bacterium]